MTPIVIQPEEAEHADHIQDLYTAGFPDGPEGKIVATLRETCPEYQGWVATAQSSRIVGHILFTPAELRCTNASETIVGLGLAPLVVHPNWQKQGIGSDLVRKSMKTLEAPFIVALGDRRYYRKFGFKTAIKKGFHCEYPDTPEDSFLIHLAEPDQLKNKTGTIYYRPEFAEAV
ncbi:MAG: N-acetyltransferase [Limnothrix sp.]